MQGAMDRSEAVRKRLQAIKAGMDNATDKQTMASCIMELQGLLSDPSVPPYMVNIILRVLNEAAEKEKAIAPMSFVLVDVLRSEQKNCCISL